MKKGITTEELSYSFTEEEAIQKYAEIGFDALDYSYDMYAYSGSPYDCDDYLDYAKKIKRIADENQIRINQLHAPLYHHRLDKPMSDKEAKEEQLLKKLTFRSFEVAHILDCHYIVMHPRKFSNYKTQEDHLSLRKYNIDMFRDWIPYAKKYNVKIAIENMFVLDSKTHTAADTALRTAEEIVSYIEELGSEYFVACLDTGHANINGIDPSYMAKVLGNHLKVLHINDNYANMDQHLICGFGTIDWHRFISTLKEIEFDGVFSLETNGMIANLDHLACEDCVRFEYQVINKILEKFDE